MLGGLWFSDKKPVMSTFLKPVKTSVEDLEMRGNIDLQILCSKK